MPGVRPSRRLSGGGWCLVVPAVAQCPQVAWHDVDADLDREVFGGVGDMPDLEYGLGAFELKGALLGIGRYSYVHVLGEPDGGMAQLGQARVRASPAGILLEQRLAVLGDRPGVVRPPTPTAMSYRHAPARQPERLTDCSGRVVELLGLYRWLYSGQGQKTFVLVEARGLEPLTPALQRRCSAS